MVVQMVKSLPTLWETQVQSLSWEDPLENRMVTHSSILAWRIPWTEDPGGLQSMGSQRVKQDWESNCIALHTYICKQLNHFTVHLKLTQCCKWTIFQFFKSYTSGPVQVFSVPENSHFTCLCHRIMWKLSSSLCNFLTSFPNIPVHQCHHHCLDKISKCLPFPYLSSWSTLSRHLLAGRTLNYIDISIFLFLLLDHSSPSTAGSKNV